MNSIWRLWKEYTQGDKYWFRLDRQFQSQMSFSRCSWVLETTECSEIYIWVTWKSLGSIYLWGDRTNKLSVKHLIIYNVIIDYYTRVTYTRVAEFVSHRNGGPESWDFPVDTEHQWSILFLTQHHRIVLRMFPLCLNMEVSEVNERVENVKQVWYQNVSFVPTKKTHTNTCYFIQK